MNDPFPRGMTPRAWRQDQGALAAGVCAGLAEDLDLPLPLVRIVALIFLLLPTGLAYVALGLLLRRREDARRASLGVFGEARTYAARAGTRPRGVPLGASAGNSPLGGSWPLLRQRLELLEPRLSKLETYVTSNEFELHRGFRSMGE